MGEKEEVAKEIQEIAEQYRSQMRERGRIGTPGGLEHIEQMWEGIVTEVGTDFFSAKLVNFNTGDEDEAEIPTSNVSDDDRELLTPGGGAFISQSAIRKE